MFINTSRSVHITYKYMWIYMCIYVSIYSVYVYYFYVLHFCLDTFLTFGTANNVNHLGLVSQHQFQ